MKYIFGLNKSGKTIVEIMDKTTQPMEEAPILFRLIYRVLQKLSLTIRIAADLFFPKRILFKLITSG